MSSGKQRRLFTLNPVAAAAVRSLAPAGVGLLWVAMASMAQAGPQGGQVTAGQASITQTGATTTIHQTSARAAIDWQSFNVGAAETVRFQQPSASAVSLNRVLGNDPSGIFGRITANGQVLLLNPNGILFGRSAQVDVGGLVAATANIANADFMAGRLQFSQSGKPGATVVNEGRITVADGGLVALVGRGVSNSGVIQARLGKVALAAGDAFVLDLYGDRLVNLVVEPQLLATLTDSSGVPLAARLDVLGQVMADGGTVQLSAATVQRLVDSVINVSGTVRATSFDALPGRISLRGDSGTRLTLAGTLDTSGTLGGSVSVTAHAVQLADTARVHAGGRHGGGTVEIGGNWQGAGPLPNATDVQVARGAMVDASAHDTGDGGTVVLWSDGNMRFAGHIDAKGGAAGGDGGRVEVSGKLRLGFDGDVNASAAAGRSGELLLDPTNLIVTRSSGGETLPGAGTTGDFSVKAAAVNRLLVNGTSVTLQATNDITVEADAVIDGRVASGGAPGGGLTLQADRDISVNGLIILNNGNFAAGAGRQFTQAAGSAIATGTGAIGIVAAGGVLASNLITNGAVDIASSGGGVRITEALGGANGVRLASLRVQGQADVSLLRGALVAGTTQLGSSAGVLDTRTGTLDSTGAVTLTGATALRTGAIVSPAAVIASSGVGPIALGAVAAAAGTVNSSSLRTASLTLRTAGDVSLSGAALGAGGLRVEGAMTGQRAGAVDVGAASVFSQGDVQVTAASIRLATQAEAGIQTSGSLTLDASGALASGAGRIESAGAAALRAGQGLVLGIGGLQVTGAQRASLSAAGELRIDGALGSAGGAELTSTGASVVLNRNVNATSFTATAATTFTQGADSAVAAGSGAITITASNGNLSATNLVTTGAVALNAAQGALAVSGALSGASGRLASLQATSRDNLTLNGALVAGTTSLSSTAGTVNTSAATLDSTGAVTLTGATGITAGALVTPAAVLASSTTGAISLGAVAGSAGEVNEQTAAALGLTVKTGGNVTLAGAALGAGGLVVEGATQGSRAGAVALGNASVFSAGAVRVDAASVTLAAAGIKTASTLRLDASGALASGAGKLESAGPATLVAGTTATLGAGGLFAGGAGTTAITAVSTLTLTGGVQSAAAVELRSTGGAVAVDGNVNGSGVLASAATTLTQSVNSIVSAGAGALSLTSAGNLSAQTLVATGAVSVESLQGTVTIAGSVSGGANAAAASFRAVSRGNMALAGTRVLGAIEAESTQGTLSATGTLEAGGNVSALAAGAIALGAITSPGDVLVRNGSGNVLLGAVAGAAGTLDAQTPAAASLTVRTAGGATLGGASVGNGGLKVEGLTPGSPVASLAMGIGAAGIYSVAPVNLSSQGNLSLGAAGVRSAAAVSLTSVTGSVLTGTGLVNAGTTATLTAAQAVNVGAGGVSAVGNVTLTASSAGVLATGRLGTQGGVVLVQSTGSSADVVLSDISTSTLSSSGSLVVDSARHIRLATAIGGPTTGYASSSFGYKPALRPAVGAVTLRADGDIELNGLNLDGPTATTQSGVGLQVRAGHRIVSNDPIAVTKGGIELTTLGSGALDGIYLGDGVYSRGFDVDGTAAAKIWYPISINANAGSIVLFGRTASSAQVPYEFDSSSTKGISKIVVANNVDNYGTSYYVSYDPARPSGPGVSVTGSLRAVSVFGGQRLSLGNLPTALGGLETAQSASYNGIGLKLVPYAGPPGNYTSTNEPEVIDDNWLNSGSIAPCSLLTYFGCNMDVVRNTAGEWNGSQTAMPSNTSIYYVRNNSVTGGTGTTNPGVYGYRQFQNAYIVSTTLNIDIPYRFYTLLVENLDMGGSGQGYNSHIGVAYAQTGRIVQAPIIGNAVVPQMLIYPGVLETNSAWSTFNNTNGLSGGNSASPTLGTVPASNPNFQPVGSFGAVQPGTVSPSATSNGGTVNAGSLPATSLTAPGVNANTGTPSFGELAAGQAGPGTSNGAGTLVGFGPLGATSLSTAGINGTGASLSFGSLSGGAAIAGAANAAAAPVSLGSLASGSAAGAVPNSFLLPAAPVPEAADGSAALAPRPADLSIVDGLPTLAELLDFGARPAAQADLGRGGPSAGVATNVFRKRYLLGRTLDNSVCGGPDLQAAPEAAGKGRNCP